MNITNARKTTLQTSQCIPGKALEDQILTCGYGTRKYTLRLPCVHTLFTAVFSCPLLQNPSPPRALAFFVASLVTASPSLQYPPTAAVSCCGILLVLRYPPCAAVSSCCSILNCRGIVLRYPPRATISSNSCDILLVPRNPSLFAVSLFCDNLLLGYPRATASSPNYIIPPSLHCNTPPLPSLPPLTPPQSVPAARRSEAASARVITRESMPSAAAAAVAAAAAAAGTETVVGWRLGRFHGWPRLLNLCW